jgi:hypothetical protein
MEKIKIDQEFAEKYPDLTDYIYGDCSVCSKSCDIPSMQMFSCMMKKISNGINRGKKEENINEESVIIRTDVKCGPAEHDGRKSQQLKSIHKKRFMKKETRKIIVKDTKLKIKPGQTDLRGYRLLPSNGRVA